MHGYIHSSPLCNCMWISGNKIPTQVQACIVQESLALAGLVKDTWEFSHFSGLCQMIGTWVSFLGLLTKRCKPEGLKQQIFSLSQFWRLESEVKVLAGPGSPWSLQERICLCFFWLLVVTGNPCSVVALLQSLPPSSHCLLLFFLFLSLTRTSVMAFRTHLVNPA